MSKDKVLYMDCADPEYQRIYECSTGSTGIEQYTRIIPSPLDSGWTPKGLAQEHSILANDSGEDYTILLDKERSISLDVSEVNALYMLLDYTLKHSKLLDSGRFPAKFLKFREMEDA